MIDASKVDNIQTILAPASASGSKADTARKALSGDLNNFLKLLTVQLKHQDPSQPFDTKEITQQIAQLATVEQQTATNKNLETLVSMYSSTQVSGVVDYIGKRVEAEGNQGTLVGGKSTFLYTLAEEPEAVNYTISNAAGRVVHTGVGTRTLGRNEIHWDGHNSVTGGQEPDGAYTLHVKAKTAGGKEAPVATLTSGRVIAVEMKDGVAQLQLGGVALPLSKVLFVREDNAVLQASNP